jgi:hypothetical protein
MTSDQNVMADFLQTDVQDYRPRITEIHEALVNKRHAVFVGNAFELMLSETQATLRHTHGRHNPTVLALADFEAAFHAWVAALPKA